MADYLRTTFLSHKFMSEYADICLGRLQTTILFIFLFVTELCNKAMFIRLSYLIGAIKISGTVSEIVVQWIHGQNKIKKNICLSWGNLNKDLAKANLFSLLVNRFIMCTHGHTVYSINEIYQSLTELSHKKKRSILNNYDQG